MPSRQNKMTKAQVVDENKQLRAEKAELERELAEQRERADLLEREAEQRKEEAKEAAQKKGEETPQDGPPGRQPHTKAVETLKKLSKRMDISSDEVIEALLLEANKTIRLRSLAGTMANLKRVRKAFGVGR